MIFEPHETLNIIHEYRKVIRRLRRCLFVCMVGWLLTLVTILAVLYTGKIPPLELNMSEPNFGSFYSE